MAAKYEVPFLGHIPLDPDIRIGGDTGAPVVARGPDASQAKAFYEVAEAVAASIRAIQSREAADPVVRIRD